LKLSRHKANPLAMSIKDLRKDTTSTALEKKAAVAMQGIAATASLGGKEFW
jgi:hypothetical protein